VWQRAVGELAALSSVPLIDVSEPTDNVLWEVDELLRRFGDRCVFIGEHDRVLALAGRSTSASPRMASERALVIRLAGREILAYTTDRDGLKRFARALRGVLLERSHPA
jgi:hypothetical protein